MSPSLAFFVVCYFETNSTRLPVYFTLLCFVLCVVCCVYFWFAKASSGTGEGRAASKNGPKEEEGKKWVTEDKVTPQAKGSPGDFDGMLLSLSLLLLVMVVVVVVVVVVVAVVVVVVVEVHPSRQT